MEIAEITRNEQFFLFPQCFQKLSVVDVSKWVPMEQRVKKKESLRTISTYISQISLI